MSRFDRSIVLGKKLFIASTNRVLPSEAKAKEMPGQTLADQMRDMDGYVALRNIDPENTIWFWHENQANHEFTNFAIVGGGYVRNGMTWYASEIDYQYGKVECVVRLMLENQAIFPELQMDTQFQIKLQALQTKLRDSKCTPRQALHAVERDPVLLSFSINTLCDRLFSSRLLSISRDLEPINLQANRAKFKFDPNRKRLDATGDRHLVEASPLDAVYGIADKRYAHRENRLGGILARVRDINRLEDALRARVYGAIDVDFPEGKGVMGYLIRCHDAQYYRAMGEFLRSHVLASDAGPNTFLIPLQINGINPSSYFSALPMPLPQFQPPPMPLLMQSVAPDLKSQSHSLSEALQSLSDPQSLQKLKIGAVVVGIACVYCKWGTPGLLVIFLAYAAFTQRNEIQQRVGSLSSSTGMLSGTQPKHNKDRRPEVKACIEEITGRQVLDVKWPDRNDPNFRNGYYVQLADVQNAKGLLDDLKGLSPSTQFGIRNAWVHIPKTINNDRAEDFLQFARAQKLRMIS